MTRHQNAARSRIHLATRPTTIVFHSMQIAGIKKTMSEKVYMLNVLWFKKEDGAKKYAEYLAAAAPFVQELGGRLVESYVPEFAVIGKWDPDLVFVVEWPNWEAFLKLTQHSGYQSIAHLREESLRDSLLIRCRREMLKRPE